MHLHQKGTPGYILNLDPAVSNVPYEPNIDIRDTVGHRLFPHVCIELCQVSQVQRPSWTSKSWLCSGRVHIVFTDGGIEHGNVSCQQSPALQA